MVAAGGHICRRPKQFFRADTTRPLEKFRKNPTCGLVGDAITRKRLRTDVWTADGPLLDKLYLELKCIVNKNFISRLIANLANGVHETTRTVKPIHLSQSRVTVSAWRV